MDDTRFIPEDESDPSGRPPLLDDGQVEPITMDDIEDALDAFDDEFPELSGLLDAEPA